jgi:hypothetical protein
VNRDRFWQLVDNADGDAEELVEVLLDTSPEEIVGFEVELDALLDESNRWELWAAAYLINGGASEDAFDYFRGWLLLQGRTVWDAALADPDSLADVVDPQDGDLDEEDVLHAAADAYERLTGDEEGFWVAVEAATATAEENPDRPTGEFFPFDDDARMAALLPRLWALFTA